MRPQYKSINRFLVATNMIPILLAVILGSNQLTAQEIPDQVFVVVHMSQEVHYSKELLNREIAKYTKEDSVTRHVRQNGLDKGKIIFWEKIDSLRSIWWTLNLSAKQSIKTDLQTGPVAYLFLRDSIYFKQAHKESLLVFGDLQIKPEWLSLKLPEDKYSLACICEGKARESTFLPTDSGRVVISATYLSEMSSLNPRTFTYEIFNGEKPGHSVTTIALKFANLENQKTLFDLAGFLKQKNRGWDVPTITEKLYPFVERNMGSVLPNNLNSYLLHTSSAWSF
ncbi:MAG TPA: hypothetical protein VMH27_09740 [Puia sp.]|nr:hypothetical protein [Puia sp.]